MSYTHLALLAYGCTLFSGANQADSHPCGPPKGKEHINGFPHFNLKSSFLNSFSHLFPCYFHLEWSHMPKEKPHTIKVICSLALFLKGRIPGRAKTSKNKTGGDIQKVILNISLEIILLHYGLALVKWLYLFHSNWLLYFLGIKEESLLEEEEYKMLQKKGYGVPPVLQ